MCASCSPPKTAGPKRFEFMMGRVPQSPADWFQLGQSLEAEGRFGDAVEAYDRSIDGLRSFARETATRRTLGVCWMNRGNALQKVGSQVRLAEAVASYDQAIGLFETLP